MKNKFNYLDYALNILLNERDVLLERIPTANSQEQRCKTQAELESVSTAVDILMSAYEESVRNTGKEIKESALAIAEAFNTLSEKGKMK